MTERILVIDDDLDSLKLIGLMLQRQGYQISAAPGGSQGLASAENEVPDLILLDIMMPDMDGYEVCRRLRKNPDLANIPIIMFTAKTGVEDKITGFEAGADDYVTKPTHPAELASRVKALLDHSNVATAVTLPKDLGEIVAVLGVKGGAGVSTLAVNLSMAIAERGRNLVLAELHRGMGAIGVQLELSHKAGLTRLFQLRLDELDRDTVEQELFEYKPGLRLLLAGYSPHEAGMSVPPGHIRRVVDLLTQTAPLVVLDLGSKTDAISLDALKQADQHILCLSPDRTSLTMAKTLLQHMEHAGIHRNRTTAVIYQNNPIAVPIDTQTIESQLVLKTLGTIVPAPELANRSVEEGKPMFELQPQGPTAAAFSRLADSLIADLNGDDLSA